MEQPPGIPNCGNTCHAGACIQLIRAIVKLQDKLESPVLHSGKPVGSTLVSNYLKECKIGTEQEDAKITMDRLIECNSDLAKITNKIIVNKTHCSACGRISVSESKAVNMFVCDRSSSGDIAYALLGVDTVRSGWRCTCGVVTDAKHRSSLKVLPSVFLAFVHHYEGRQKQPLEYITNEEFKYSFKQGNKKTIIVYKLVGSIDHHGDEQSGHYVARVMRDGKAWLCDDMSVSRIDNVKPTRDTLLFCYEKQ